MRRNQGRESVKARLTTALAFALALVAVDRPARADPYRIGPLDKLDIVVFRVPALSFEDLQVDAAGRILLPLIGPVQAAGRSAADVAAEIARRLGAKYLVSPQVSVSVVEAAQEKISVEGAVIQGGVFPMRGRTTLLEAVALAKGPSPVANLRRIDVVREQAGAPYAATYDIGAIRAGRQADPELQGDDVVVVESSRVKSAWRGLVDSIPAMNAVSTLHSNLAAGASSQPPPLEPPPAGQP